MKYSLSALLVMMLAGCSAFDSSSLDLNKHPIINKRLMLVLEDPQHNFADPKVQGRAGWYTHDGVTYCHIFLRKYPHYLGHEVDHCIRGFWHGLEPNGEDFK